MKTPRYLLVLLTCCGLVTTAAADDYDFQVDLTYGWGQSESTIIPTVNGVPDPSLGTNRTSSDSDIISLTGVWFYSGLSDAKGPKSRAAFMSRASGIVMSYSRGDESGSLEISGGILPPASASFDATSDELSLDLRHVWQDSGWFALAGFSRVEVDGESTSIGGGVSFSSADANGYRLGFGKYLGEATTLELGITTLDVGSSNPTVVALSFSHIGSLGANWQFGTDVAYAKSDTGGEGDAFALRGSLFPTDSIEFGLAFSRNEPVDGFEIDALEAFGGWFIRDNVELVASFRLDDPEEGPGQDADSDEFTIGAKVRF